MDPEDLIPKLPKPKDLYPFPTTETIVRTTNYITNNVTSLVMTSLIMALRMVMSLIMTLRMLLLMTSLIMTLRMVIVNDITDHGLENGDITDQDVNISDVGVRGSQWTSEVCECGASRPMDCLW